MNIGIISTRYARALFSLASDSGQEETVYKEMKSLSKQFIRIPELRRYLSNPIMKTDKKTELLIAATGEKVSPITENFLRFVIQREKQDYVQYISMSYQDIYRKAKNIVSTTFVTAQEVDNDTLKKITELIERTYSATVELNVEIDKKLIGGFVLDVENNRLDASVSGELRKLRQALHAG